MFGIDSVLKTLNHKTTDSMNELKNQWMLKVFKEQPRLLKLDGVGPVDNRPSTDKLINW